MINSINNGYGIYGSSSINRFSTAPVTPARPATNQINNYRYNLFGNALDAESKEFINQYQNKFQDLKKAASSLDVTSSESVWNKNKGTDSGTDALAETTADKATISAEDLAKSVKDLVASHNDTVKLLSDNGAQGTGVKKQLVSLLAPPISENAMASMGLSYKADGKLAFDEDQLKTTFSKDPGGTKELLGGSEGVSRRLGLGAGQALKESSYNLVNKAMADKQTQINRDPLNFSNAYSKYGGYTPLSTNYVGILFNALA